MLSPSVNGLYASLCICSTFSLDTLDGSFWTKIVLCLTMGFKLLLPIYNLGRNTPFSYSLYWLLVKFSNFFFGLLKAYICEVEYFAYILWGFK
jgi:hypothetical protein